MTARRRSQAGFTLLELLISMSIMVGVTGAIFAMINPGQGAFRVQPEVSDLQQRLRIAADMINRDLMMAGAGTYSGAAVGPLIQFFPPVVPYRLGKQASDAEAGTFFRSDAVTIIYVPETAAQTTTLDPIAGPSTSVGVVSAAGCPAGDGRCGFDVGQTVLVFDDSGSFDTFVVTGVQDQQLQLERQGQDVSKTYASGAYISQAETHTYYLDPDTDRLMHYDGWESDVPLVDDVVGLEFRYFGDPAPPTSPQPPIGIGNCLFDTAGNTNLASLQDNHHSLIELDPSLLTDGPWCGGDNPFDADLYRIRNIRVELRLQASASDLRGADPDHFRRPGSAVQGTRMLRDYEMSLDVSPRNMGLGR